MPLENQNPELLQRQRQQRIELKDNFFRQDGLQQRMAETTQQMLNRKEELRNRLKGQIPEGPLPQSGEALARIRPSYAERKKLKAEKKAVKSVLMKSAQAVRAGSAAYRSMERYASEGDHVSEKTENQLEKAQKKLLSDTLEAIQEKEKLLLSGVSSEKERLEVQRSCQDERVQAAARYAASLPEGSVQRQKAMAMKEKAQIQRNDFHRLLKILNMPDGPEKDNAAATYKRHKKFDFFKGIFRKDNPLSREEAAYRSPGGALFVNKGRAFFGGTKPMYIFENRNEQLGNDGGEPVYQEYLYKEAINCIGFDKPQGALVTEAASQLQQRLCGPDHSIPAQAVRVNGKVVGSLQKKVESWRDGDVGGTPPPDLFQWQQNPDETLNADTPEMEEIRAGLLREHALDWLLCNFDTKGENFLFDRQRRLVSFDKEASFSFLNDSGSQDMSYTYKPHSNDTIYNVLFRRYAQGQQTLDLTKTAQVLEQIEAMDDGEYMQQFEAMLTEKYGSNTEDYREQREKILQRKREIRQKYAAFYGKLIQERRNSLAAAGQPDDTQGLLAEDGTPLFLETRASVAEKLGLPEDQIVQETIPLRVEAQKRMERLQKPDPSFDLAAALQKPLDIASVTRQPLDLAKGLEEFERLTRIQAVRSSMEAWDALDAAAKEQCGRLLEQKDAFTTVLFREMQRLHVKIDTLSGRASFCKPINANTERKEDQLAQNAADQLQYLSLTENLRQQARAARAAVPALTPAEKQQAVEKERADFRALWGDTLPEDMAEGQWYDFRQQMGNRSRNQIQARSRRSDAFWNGVTGDQRQKWSVLPDNVRRDVVGMLGGLHQDVDHAEVQSLLDGLAQLKQMDEKAGEQPAEFQNVLQALTAQYNTCYQRFMAYAQPILARQGTAYTMAGMAMQTEDMYNLYGYWQAMSEFYRQTPSLFFTIPAQQIDEVRKVGLFVYSHCLRDLSKSTDTRGGLRDGGFPDGDHGFGSALTQQILEEEYSGEEVKEVTAQYDRLPAWSPIRQRVEDYARQRGVSPAVAACLMRHHVPAGDGQQG
ncbi:MAG TPA: hypothetical protein IAB66_12055 [Candidatus Caccousia avistercoris]|nr:hypothetical protein [Candidatus Caccousia avistercoris]